VERQSLSALAADAGQLFQFVDEPGHRLGKFRHEVQLRLEYSFVGDHCDYAIGSSGDRVSG
jgi:hypothetical protein